ncbi:hypothetical protein EUX98_g6665 [Antrodiella citrinella]|uniref:Uncharacterized protein n=1 Tax=Antrodiella citrinella TaxID=2447956 RepID=A0A4S4MQF9_9APHY|nr:hypothetical protein EUX98_g6665 [Antrodiella citrinella]
MDTNKFGFDASAPVDLAAVDAAVVSHLLPKFVRQLDSNEVFASFYNTIWGQQNYGPHNVIENRSIPRDGSPSSRLDDALCKVPNQCLVFPGFDLGLFNLSCALVRQEYIKGLKVISEFSKRPRDIISDYFTTDTCDSLPHTLFEHFKDGDSVGSRDRAGGVSVVAHPGTGKSLFLRYTLLTRLLARRTTVWTDGPDLYIFTNEGVFHVSKPTNALARELSTLLPTSTWALVDSTPETPSVPEYILHLDVFVLQAACSRPDCFDWLARTNRVSTKYYMEPWNLAELIAAKDLHLTSPGALSEVDIATNFDTFGPSARLVFTECSVATFHRDVLGCAGQLREGALSECIHRMKQNEFRDDCHKLLVLQPGARRDEPQVVARTRYACKVLQHEGLQSVPTLVDKLHTPAEFVLEYIMRTHFTKGGTFPLVTVPSRGDMNGKGKFLPQTTWKFTVPTYQHVRANPDSWLRVGYRSEPAIHITDSPLVSASGVASPIEPVTPFTPFTLAPMTRQASLAAPSTPATALPRSNSESRAYYRWLAHPSEVPSKEPEELPPKPVSVHLPPTHQDVRQPMRTGFIPPRTRYAPPYDFIAYNAEDHSAIVLEAFYASTERSFTMSAQGVKWLQTKRVTKISYVAVLLGPHANTTLEFHQPAAPFFADTVNVYK